MAQAVVDGSSITELVQDERAFGKYVDEKFEALDSGKTGRLSAQELQPAVLGLGGALGLPPKGSSPETDPVYDQLLKSFLSERGGKVTKAKFATVMRDMLLGLADGLQREPINVLSLDGKRLREYAQQTDAEVSAVAAFVDMDTESSGKVKAAGIREAMKKLSVEQGAPPYNEGSKQVLDVALRRAGVDEEAYVDQIQFVELFKKVLLEMSALLQEKPLTVAHIEKKFDGESVKHFLSDKKGSKKAISEVFKSLPKAKHGSTTKESLIYGLDALAPKVGLPPFGAVEEMDVEMEEALKMVDSNPSSQDQLIDSEAFEQYLRQVLGSIMLQLEGKPIVIASSAIVSEAQAGNPAAIF